LLPSGVSKLLSEGIDVTVERCSRRIIADSEYEKTGCNMAKSGSWIQADEGAFILGLKEIPSKPNILNNSHIFFAHAYKNQTGWQKLLKRFTKGGSEVLDIEYMVKPDGRRVVAFGYWAGYMGAALALLHWYSQKKSEESSLDHGVSAYENAADLDKEIMGFSKGKKAPKVLIIGAGGRSGTGAKAILERHGAEITCWGRKETLNIDREKLMSFDMMINCVFLQDEVPAFIRKEDITPEANLSVISDISCDPFSSFNPLPIYDDVTSWAEPYHKILGTGGKVIDLIAIDNLPSLLPREASLEFSELLLPHLEVLFDESQPVWDAARSSFEQAISKI
jgi:saccharopine dehydrogenase (NAD+, L-lysine-forming)